MNGLASSPYEPSLDSRGCGHLYLICLSNLAKQESYQGTLSLIASTISVRLCWSLPWTCSLDDARLIALAVHCGGLVSWICGLCPVGSLRTSFAQLSNSSRNDGLAINPGPACACPLGLHWRSAAMCVSIYCRCLSHSRHLLLLGDFRFRARSARHIGYEYNEFHGRIRGCGGAQARSRF